MGNEALRGVMPEGPPSTAEVITTVGGTSGPPRVTLRVYVIGPLGKAGALWDFARRMGMGDFRCCIDVYGLAWSFAERGIFWYPSSASSSGTEYRSQTLGATFKSNDEVLQLMLTLGHRWPGTAFDAISRNSYHFCQTLCERLGVGPYPTWVEELQANTGLAMIPRICCSEEDRPCNTPAPETVEPDPVATARFAKWCDDHVSTMRCDSSGGSHPMRKPAYQLVRERWLRTRRAKGSMSTAYSVRPPPHVDPVPELGQDSWGLLGPDCTDDLLWARGVEQEEVRVFIPYSASVAADAAAALSASSLGSNDGVDSEASDVDRFSGSHSGGFLSGARDVHSMSDADDADAIRLDGLGLVIARGSPALVLAVDFSRGELSAARPGDVIDVVDGVRILTGEEFAAAVANATADRELVLTLTRPVEPAEFGNGTDVLDDAYKSKRLERLTDWLDGYMDALSKPHRPALAAQLEDRRLGNAGFGVWHGHALQESAGARRGRLREARSAPPPRRRIAQL